MAGVNPKMIVLARESRGYTQKAIAKQLDILPSRLSRIEAGLIKAPDDFVSELSSTLGYPKDFFYLEEEIYGLGLSGMHNIFYRRRKSVSMLQLNTVQAQINIRRIHLLRLLKSVEVEHSREMPYLDIDEYNGNAFTIAQAVRAMWRIPAGPIDNIVKLIESAGGIVIECDFGSDKIDAISVLGNPSFFFINPTSPGDRLRFSIAHELGHIVMHRIPNPDMEDEANQFASEFLMPKHEIAPSLRRVNLKTLANLKPYWKVAMAALLYRAREIDAVNQRYYQYLWTQMAPYRKREPQELDIPVERPELINKIIETYTKKLNFSISDISNMLHLFEDEAKELYMHSTKTPHLRIVKRKKGKMIN